MTLRTLDDWLRWQENLFQSQIQLGLERIRTVAQRMGLLHLPVPVLTVGGTNGKGSTCAMLTRILQVQGYKVGTYTSPHLQHYNERIAIDGVPVADDVIVAAFRAIDKARDAINLTYFEFGTLAAVWCFLQAKVDVMVLEVGMGGRLDACNLWDADVAIITSISLDHMEWLGNTREAIGREKAGIMRPGKPVICGDPDPPASISQEAARLGARLLQYGRGFTADALPPLSLVGEFQRYNAACVVTALRELAPVLPVSPEAIRAGLASTTLSGRMQRVQTAPEVLLDVAHNPAAAQALANWLQKNPVAGKTFAIFSILGDKDIAGVVQAMQPCADTWFLFPLASRRAVDMQALHTALGQAGVEQTRRQDYPECRAAWEAVASCVGRQDRVVAFGSFLVVSAMQEIFTPK